MVRTFLEMENTHPESTGVRSPDSEKVKCVLVGDGAVGKTSIIVSYTTNGYQQEYVPTAFDNYSVIVQVDGKPVQLEICDTAGQDDFNSLRPLCYPDSDVFLLCFSVVAPTSFHNLKDHWLPEIRKHSPNAPVVVVGTQCDLRNDVNVYLELARYGEAPIQKAAAMEFAKSVDAYEYIECSALTQHNLKIVFDTVILASIGYRLKLKTGCTLRPLTTTSNSRSSLISRKSFRKLREKLSGTSSHSSRDSSASEKNLHKVNEDGPLYRHSIPEQVQCSTSTSTNSMAAGFYNFSSNDSSLPNPHAKPVTKAISMQQEKLLRNALHEYNAITDNGRVVTGPTPSTSLQGAQHSKVVHTGSSYSPYAARKQCSNEITYCDENEPSGNRRSGGWRKLLCLV